MADDPNKALADAVKAQEKEWGTYIAVVPIDIDGVRAFNAGHAVPFSHVERGLVAKASVRKSTEAEAGAAVPAPPVAL